MQPNPATRTKVVMIGGLPRSGTTIVTDVLNESTQAAVMSEYEVYELIRDLEPIFSYGNQRDYIWSDFEIVSANNVEQPSASNHYLPHANPPMRHGLRYPLRFRTGAIASAVIMSSLDKPEARLVGSKYPLFMLKEGHLELHDHFDDVYYVVLVRNPVDQINSSLNRRNRTVIGVDNWHVKTIDEAVVEYRGVISRTISLLNRFPEKCMIIKFEDLEQNAEVHLRALFDFLGLDDEPSFDIITAQRGVTNILTQNERAHIRDCVGDILDQWSTLKMSGTSHTMLDPLAKLCPPWPSERGGDIAGLTQALGIGWSFPDPDGIWSVGGRADLVFAPAKVASRYYVKLEAAWHLRDRPLGVKIDLNGDLVFDAVLVAGHIASTGGGKDVFAIPVPHDTTVMWLGPVTPRTDGPNLLSFSFTGEQSPKSLGLSDDPRRLGMHIRSLHASDDPRRLGMHIRSLDAAAL